MTFFVRCSAIMEVVFVNISPLPAGRALNFVIREGAGGIREAKGFLFHVLLCLLASSSRIQLLQSLASLLEGCSQAQSLKRQGTSRLESAQETTAMPSPMRSAPKPCLERGLLRWYLSARQSGCSSSL